LDGSLGFTFGLNAFGFNVLDEGFKIVYILLLDCKFKLEARYLLINSFVAFYVIINIFSGGFLIYCDFVRGNDLSERVGV